MTPRRATPPPLWFPIAVAVALAVACRALAPSCAWGHGDGHSPAPVLAFWGFFVTLVGAIWNAFQVVGAVTLEVLQWLVANLGILVARLVNGLKWVGRNLLDGLHKVWTFSKLTYERVLKPAFSKIARWFDRLKQWLDNTFGPVIAWLRRLRDTLLRFWATFVRPWLDLIDVTRRVLRVLSSLGLRWARELDNRLGAIEDAIERPFRLVLEKVNEVINLVNRVVTLDGLIQRLALIGSLARDYEFAWRAIVNPYSKPVTHPSVWPARKSPEPKPLATIENEYSAYIRDGGGGGAEEYRALAALWRAELVRPR